MQTKPAFQDVRSNADIAPCLGVVMPIYNEQDTVAEALRRVLAQRPVQEVIAVDDASSDRSWEMLQSVAAGEPRLKLLRHDRNRGKGAALRTGLRKSLEDGFEWAFSMDGDGQHRPGDLPIFLECAERTGAVLVVGNRMHDPKAIPRIRRQANRWMSRRLSQHAGHALPDSQCGFRLLNLRTWATLPLRTKHFEIESEMLLAFLFTGRRIEFVPIQVVGRGTRSHINPLLDTLRWLRWWWGVGREDKPKSRSGTG